LKYVSLLGLLVFATLPWNGALADQSAFQSGVVAFQDGDLERARRLLEQARDGGMTSSTLQYNLGVIYFRLGLYDKAETAFSTLLDTPDAPLARYNLGLVLQKKGDTEGAIDWFRQAADESSPQKVQALAQQQLVKPARNSSSNIDSTRTIGFLSVATGYDNNIASTPSGATTNEAGAFGDLLLSGRAYLNQGRGRAIRLDAVAYTRQYPGNAEFDNAYLGVGVAWQQPLEAARLVSGVTVSRFWFGANLLEQQVRLDVTYDRPGCFWPALWMVDCELEGFASTIQGGSGFSAYDGELYGGAINVVKNAGRWRFDSAYRFEVDRRDDLETVEEFFSLSPTRHTYSFSAARQVTDLLSFGAKQTFRLSRYDDPHRVIESGQIETSTREDKQFRTLLFAGFQLDRRWRLGIELGWVDNQSTLNRYRYDRTEFLVSLDGVF